MLYGAFSNEGIFLKEVGSDPCLIDGFCWKDDDLLEFNPEKCRKGNVNSGWLLHLHGTPLYHEKDGNIFKRTIRDIEGASKELGVVDIQEAVESHFVLTAPYDKEQIINKSEVLKYYWEEFKSLLCSHASVVFIGYGGHDPHINQAIRCANLSKVKVIEYDHSDGKPKCWYRKELREKFWRAKFGSEKNDLESVSNINQIDIRDCI